MKTDTEKIEPKVDSIDETPAVVSIEKEMTDEVKIALESIRRVIRIRKVAPARKPLQYQYFRIA